MLNLLERTCQMTHYRGEKSSGCWIEPTTLIWGVCSTAVLQPLPQKDLLFLNTIDFTECANTKIFYSNRYSAGTAGSRDVIHDLKVILHMCTIAYTHCPDWTKNDNNKSPKWSSIQQPWFQDREEWCWRFFCKNLAMNHEITASSQSNWCCSHAIGHFLGFIFRQQLITDYHCLLCYFSLFCLFHQHKPEFEPTTPLSEG